MPLKATKSRMTLTGDVVVDDAETLYGWLASHKKATVSCAGVHHLHTAVLQALAAAPRPIAPLPNDPFLAECIRQLTPKAKEN